MTKFEMDGEETTYLGANDELGTCELDGGYWLRAITMEDPDGKAPDQMQDGLWPSMDPFDPGYIGINLKTGKPWSRSTFRRRMAEAKEIMRLWQVANDLIPEAIDDAGINGHLLPVIAGVLKTRQKHSEADALSVG